MDDELTGAMHETQMQILGALAQVKSARFSDLTKVTGLTSDHANFHIKKLVERAFVEHVPKTYGEYRLTRAGKDYSTRMNTMSSTIDRPPKVSVVLWVTNEQGQVLRQQRLKQPYYGYWSRPTGKVRRGEAILEAAARKLKEETGLKADMHIIGIEHRIDRDKQGVLYDDKYLFMVEGSKPRGTLIVEQAGVHNYWMSESEYMQKEKRFGKPISTNMSIDSEHIKLTEGVFTFGEEDF